MSDSRDSPDLAASEAKGLSDLNSLALPDAEAAFLHCCGSTSFAKTMAERRPFSSLDAAKAEARTVWAALSPADWDEAFKAHPEIGGKKAEGPQTAHSASWSAGEQAKVGVASTTTLGELASINAKYREKFGRIYIVCATGRTAEELLAVAKARLDNDAPKELVIAAEEQAKITALRLEKLVFGKR